MYVIFSQEGNFDLHLQSLAQIVPWMFALYQTHYSRWLSVGIRYMMSLLVNHPNIREDLCAGHIVVLKTSIQFSAMAIDQSHEQINGPSTYQMPKNQAVPELAR